MKRILAIAFAAILLASQAFAAPHSVVLTWQPSADAVANPSLTYFVYRGTAAGSEAASPLNTTGVGTACTGPTGGCTFTDSNVAPGKYFYVVTASLNGANSTPSNEASGLVPVAPPTNVTVSAN